MTNEIQAFTSPVFGDVRVVEIDDEPWFFARNVCDVLSVVDTNRALSGLDDDEKCEHSQYEGSGRKPILINESGLYSLILRSRKPEARDFKRWVTHDVIPAIRKRGGYLSPSVDFTDPENLQKIFDSWKAERVKRLEAEAVAKRLTHNNKTYTCTQVAKECGLRSAQELNSRLHDMGVQYKDHRGVWMMYADYATLGYTEIKEEEIYGKLTYHRKWTSKGRDFLVNLFS